MLKSLKKTDLFLTSIYEKTAQYVNTVPDRILLLLLSGFYFLWRLLMLPMFEFSGDAVWKWRFLRYYHETGVWFPLKPDHHQGRWAQNFPVAWLMDLFDSSAMWIGAICPVLYGFGTMLLTWGITRRIGSRMAAVTASLSVMLYFVFYQESAQFLPSLPCTMYTLLALYLMMLYLERPARLYLPLPAGLVMGIAWGCKVTACYWCAGMALFLILFPVPGKNVFRLRKFRIGWDVILFSLGFLAVFIPEFFLINDFFHVQHGRFDMLTGHLDGRLNASVNPYRYNLLQYIFSPFLIFLNLSGKAIYKVPFALLFLLVLPPLFLQLRDKSLPLSRKLPAFALLTAGLLHCYFVMKIFPFQHPERPLPRYFLTLSAVSLIILCTASRHLPELKEKFRGPARLIYGGLVLTLGIFMFAGWINEPVINGDHLFNKIRAYQCIQLRQANDLPLLIEYEKRSRYTTRTFKMTMLWKTALCDTGELAAILAETPDALQKKWSARPPVTDTKGKKYVHLAGPRPEPGKQTDCIVVREAHVRREMLSAADQKEQKKQ